MSGMPVGDKLKATERIKVKSESLPKVKKESGLDVYVCSLIFGAFTVAAGSSDLIPIGYAIGGLGGLGMVVDTIRSINPYRQLFENARLQMGDQIPRFLKRRKTPYGYCLTFSLPYGMSTDDFEKKKQAIEQYLNRRIEIAYNNYRIFIKVYEIELEKSPPFKVIETKGICEFPIGIAFGGKIINVDLEKAIHLLIAGETGGGKSTLLRGILTSLILSGKKISLHLIDLKNGAEFNVFRKCKMVKSFSRNIDEANEILSKLTLEVERRYELFYESDVVDIREYNKLRNVKRLDYQILAIDEFADLQDEKGSISSVERLAQKARAAGIHMILATQRPDANILNGRIKANIPTTIGLKTKNSLNSRIIIDENGLEVLRGLGHGLLSDGGLKEFQSFYITNEEARALIKHTYIEKANVVKHDCSKDINISGELKDISFIKGLLR